MTSFKDLGLAPRLHEVLDAQGYTSPTPIQAQAIPHVVTGRDLLGIAQTGTGKTAAFALPILTRLAADPKPRKPRTARVLVLSPTRELASQIGETFVTFGRPLKLSTAVVFGGVAVSPQARQLAGGVDVLVATPGRLLDHVDQRTLSLSGVEILVLDEADQMLDLGFIHALKRIVKLLPPERQNLFFSATMPRAIDGLAGEILKDPARVEVTPVATTAERVEQRLILAEPREKRDVLVKLFADPNFSRVLVFTRTKRGADKVARELELAHIDAAAIHGNKSQSQRERALASFKAGRTRALVATDIAARGIDIDAVSHVINYELPNVPESYVHRIGRTARGGASGTAVSFCSLEERPLLKDIEKLIRQRVPATDAAGNPVEVTFDRRAAGPKPSGRSDQGHGGQRREGQSRPAHGGGQRQGGFGGGRGANGQRHAAENVGYQGNGERPIAPTEPLRPAQPAAAQPRPAHGASGQPARHAPAGRPATHPAQHGRDRAEERRDGRHPHGERRDARMQGERRDGRPGERPTAGSALPWENRGPARAKDAGPRDGRSSKGGRRPEGQQRRP